MMSPELRKRLLVNIVLPMILGSVIAAIAAATDYYVLGISEMHYVEAMRYFGFGLVAANSIMLVLGMMVLFVDDSEPEWSTIMIRMVAYGGANMFTALVILYSLALTIAP